MDQGYEKRTKLFSKYAEEWNMDKKRRPIFVADI
jgi:hypothetical protein